jgi:integrase
MNAQPDRPASYKVRIWQIETYKGVRASTYRVRWTVAGHRNGEVFEKKAQADSFRSKLMMYASEGTAFDIESGLPVPMLRVMQEHERAAPTWYEHAVQYADRRWQQASPKQRASIADTLATVTPALVRSDDGKPEVAVLRLALSTWAFNVNGREQRQLPADQAAALAWVQKHALRVDELADPELMRRALKALASKMDGTPAAANTYRRKRPVFYAALTYAVRCKFLAANPLADDDIDFVGPKAVDTVDPRTVPNPTQARALIESVGTIQPSGPALKAFFGCLYYSVMRPGEAARIRDDAFVLPETDENALDEDGDEWGDVYLDKSAPRVGKSWTDNGRTRQERMLKHRAAGTVRPAPVPPAQVRLVRAHIAVFGTTPDGRLFRGIRGGDLSESTYGRVWQNARERTLTPAQLAAGLAERPYDLRHAGVSTWLKAGIEPKRVAEWAGHSVDVLLRIYTHCLDGGEDDARRRIQRTLEDG